jgi:hypothetical protein
MKKTLLLSVVASTMIMAGGDIAPVEPVVEAPAVVETSAWDFSGQATVYYQTTDVQGNGSLFEAESSVAAAALTLGAVNKDLIGGLGAGVELAGISDAFLYPDVVTGLVQNAGNGVAADDDEYVLAAGALTQAYLTYGVANTSIKVGRQQLPQALSPFAYTEGWQPVKNTFDAALIVNSDLPDTTLVGAYVTRRNNSVGNLNDFQQFWGSDGAFMVTAQNKSIANVTLTGSYYLLPDATPAGDAFAVWGDATYAANGLTVAVQGGQIGGEAVADNDTTAFGAKVAGSVGMVNLSAAYSSVDDGALNIANLAGAGVKTPLYTQAILNQNTIKRDSDTIKVTAAVKALGGKVTAAYINSDLGATALPSVFGAGDKGEGTYQEIELIYTTQVGENTKVFAAFVNQNDDRQVDDSQNFVRLWARYNF